MCTPHTPKSSNFFDFKVLLNPFEEQFQTPYVSVEPRKQFGRYLQIVCQEDISNTVLRTLNDEFPKFIKVIFGTFINQKNFR